MKPIITLTFLLLTTTLFSQIPFNHTKIQKANKNYWLGIDFYFNQLIDAKYMDRDSEIINKFCPAWLGVFDEFETDSDIKERLKVKELEFRTDLTAYRYKELEEFVAPVKRRISENGVYHYLEALELPFESGNAFIILPINMIKAEGKTEMWVVCFDVASREILGSAKILGKVNGHGMRSYWGESIVNGWRRIMKKVYR